MGGFVATIGMFDGVHRGHQFVLRHVVDEAQRRGLHSMAVTFDRQGAPTLTPLADKLRLMAQCGIERTEVLTFDDALKQLTARQFMADVLQARYDVRVLMIGYDNRFGHNRAEGFDDYVRYGRELGMDVLQLPAEGTVCSSMIRQLLTNGDVAAAAEALGYAYTISGRVAHGEHVGTQMGFPTANLVPDCATQLLPAPGVYAVRVGTHGGMMNIGGCVTKSISTVLRRSFTSYKSIHNKPNTYYHYETSYSLSAHLRSHPTDWWRHYTGRMESRCRQWRQDGRHAYYHHGRCWSADHYRIPLGSLCGGVAHMASYPSLDGADVECHCRLGSTYPVSLYSRADT